MGVCHPDPSQQLEAIEKIAAKMVEENKKVEFRYHAFCVKNGLSGGIPTQAQLDELWRYLSSEAREFAASPDKPEEPDLVKAKEAKLVQAALAAAAKAAAKGDPKGGKDPKAKGDPKGGGTGGGKPGGGKGGGTSDKPKVEMCKWFDSDNGCRFGANCTNKHRRLDPKEGKCFNCGSKHHAVAECTAPRPKASAAQHQPSQQEPP